MNNMTRFIFVLLFCACYVGFFSAVGEQTKDQGSRGTGGSFKGPVGLQLYSLRDQFKVTVPGTLDKVREFGIKYVELAGTYEVDPGQFKDQLDARGLKA